MVGSVVTPGTTMSPVVPPESGGMRSWVSGVTHYQSSIAERVKGVHTGSWTNLLLVPEPTNPHSSDAIKIYAASPGWDVELYMVGYLKRPIDSEYSKLFKKYNMEGILVPGRIEWWGEKSMYYARIDLLEPEEFDEWMKDYD